MNLNLKIKSSVTKIYLALILFLLGAFAMAGKKVNVENDWLNSFRGKTWKTLNAQKSYSVEEVSTPTRLGEKSLRFELRAKETYNVNYQDQTISSFRSEVETNDFAPINSTQWYGFSVYFPEDFPLEDNRLVFAQMWSLSVVKGKTSLTLRSPPLSFRYSNGEFSIKKCTAATQMEDEDCSQIYKTKEFTKGQWNDFVVEAKWSSGSDGLVNVWLNSNKIVSQAGAIGYSDKIGPEFKFGLYRDATEKTYVINVSNVRQGRSFDEVDPSKAHFNL